MAGTPDTLPDGRVARGPRRGLAPTLARAATRAARLVVPKESFW